MSRRGSSSPRPAHPGAPGAAGAAPGPSSLGHRPNGQWAFDAEVTRCFDDMLARSIPAYRDMRALVADLAAEFLRDGGVVVDLGCSRGEALAGLLDRCGRRVAYVGIDSSEPMVTAARRRFAREIEDGVVSIRHLDLREAFPPHQATVYLAVLTLQFIPIEYRPGLLEAIYHHLQPGGALILVEKVLGSGGRLDRLMVERYRQMKRSNGYAADEIDAKRRSLEGALVPVSVAMNEHLLHGAGFRQIETVWRWYNFVGWVGLKNPPQAE